MMKHAHKIKTKAKNTALDRLTFLSGALLPIMTVPQVYAIWQNEKNESVSLTTWGLYTAVSLLFLIFGIKHKEKLLIYTYGPMFAVEAVLVAGILVKG